MKKKHLQALIALQGGETVSSGRIPPEWAGEMEADGGVSCIAGGGGSLAYRVVSPGAFDAFVRGLGLNPGQLKETLRELEEETPSRSRLVHLTGDSKAVPSRSCPGFPVNVLKPVPVMVGERRILLTPCPGTFLYISDFRHFRIPKDAIVVGVENMENFRKPELQAKLLEKIGPNLLLVSRYPQSGDLIAWLESIPNPYVHFGDFDLAGVHIYLTEFYNRLGGRSAFFVPEDVEERLATSGCSERYETQFARFGRMPVPDPRLLPLVNLIHRYRKGYDQEGYCL